MSNTLWPYGLYRPWNSPGQKTGVVAFCFSRGPSQHRDQTQVSHVQADSLPAVDKGSPRILKPKNTRVSSIARGFNPRMISAHFQGKPFNSTVIQVCAPTSNTEEAEVEQLCEDLQDLLELTPKRGVLFIIGDWNVKVGNQETPWVTSKFGLGVQNEAGKS